MCTAFLKYSNLFCPVPPSQRVLLSPHIEYYAILWCNFIKTGIKPFHLQLAPKHV